MSKENNISIINDIITETSNVVIFKNKIESFEGIFIGIKKVIDESEPPNINSEEYRIEYSDDADDSEDYSYSSDSESEPDDIQSKKDSNKCQKDPKINYALYKRDLKEYKTNLKELKNTLTSFLEIIKKLGQKEWSISFLKSDKPIDTFLTEIDTQIKEIFSIIEDLCSAHFNIPKYDIYKDIQEIKKIINDQEQISQQRKEELKKYKIQNKQQFYDIMKIYDESGKYQIESKSYTKTVKIKSNERNEFFEGELNSTKEKVHITVLKNREDFETLFPILIKTKDKNFEELKGVSITESTIEIITKIKGEPLIDKKNISTTIISNKIAESMSYLHSENIIYRDLNLKNIYIEDSIEKSTPIITDLSECILLTNSSFLGLPNIKTTNFMCAPEIIASHTYDEEVDVFSYGSLIYELSTGISPFSGKSRSEVEKEILDGKRPDFPTNFPNNLKELIEKCWNQKATDRPSFDQIIDEMTNQNIVFPNDVDKTDQIIEFYSNKSIQNNELLTCLKYIEIIINDIRKTFLFKYELYRVQSFLKNYKYNLRHSKYRREENDELVKLKEQLIKLKIVVENSQKDNSLDWLSYHEINYQTNTINDCMNNISQILERLGLKLPKYEEDKDDIRYDYYEFKQSIIELFESESANELINNIDKYLRSKNLSGIIDDEYIYSRLNVIFSPFKSKEVDHSQFYYKNLTGDGYESKVYKGIMIVKDNNDPHKFSFENVAIKIVNKIYFENRDNLIALRREISQLTYLKNNFFLDFVGFSISRDQVWLITKFIDGKELYDAMDNMNAYEKTKAAFEIAEGMKYLHENRILHRDLKSSNIMILNNGGHAKIIDFGYSLTDVNSISKTRGRGTANYMAPEVIKGRKYDKSADVFSFALTLWELYAGIYPFSEFKNPSLVVNLIADGKRPKFDNDCPDPLKKLIIRAWDQNPAERPTFDEIVTTMKQQKISYLKGNDPKYTEMKEKIDSFYDNKH